MEKMRWMVLGMLAAGMLLAATPLAAQQRFHASLDLGVNTGEHLGTSLHTIGAFTYTPLPYLGVQIRFDGYELLGKGNRHIFFWKNPVDGTLRTTTDMDALPKQKTGMARFIGLGVAFMPIAIARPDTRNILAIEAGVGYSHEYMLRSDPDNNQSLYGHEETSLGTFATLHYRYRIWEHVSLGGYLNCLLNHSPQLGVGISGSLDI